MEKTGGGYDTRRPRHSVLHSAARATMVAGVIAVAGSAATGCLTRKVDGSDPTTKVTFNTVVQQTGVDKIDMILAIDNSLSMGDKQAYLSEAVPQLINRLVTPNCVDVNGKPVNPPTAVKADGTCANGQPEFPPVHDMHIGIVSSSLGQRGGSVCADGNAPGKTFDAHNNDRGRLLNRTGVNGDGPANPDAPVSNLLAWFPPVQANDGKTFTPSNGIKITTAPKLSTDLASLVTGVSAYGCGIESQLESWYRFLIQPDPYDSITTESNPGFLNAAKWVGVDTEILQQRHDFLRPDSLVAIINLTDENDSEVDARSVAQTGWGFLDTKFQLPQRTDACDVNKDNVSGDMSGLRDPNCTSCGLLPDGDPRKNDANCTYRPTTPPPDYVTGTYLYTAATNEAVDANLRHVHMKAKYGVDPQYPIARYVNGLTQKHVPNREGEYVGGKGGYRGNANCTNPLFAASLPDKTVDISDASKLCDLPVGTARSANQVFYAIIGGVPNELLHFKPNDSDGSTITPTDWVKILGQSPETFNYTGIDPHMIESVAPRADIVKAGHGVDEAGNGTDLDHGREWTTVASGGGDTGVGNGHILAVDLQYACTFDLQKSGKARDCTKAENSLSCDCPTDPSTFSLKPGEVPPLCAIDPSPGHSATAPTLQVRAKAYPTIRELQLAKNLGQQGIVSSICPINVVPAAGSDANTDPLYGYNPAVAVIVDRLKSALAGSCLPQPLDVAADGTVPCLILELMPQGDQATACDEAKGLTQPDPTTINRYREQQKSQQADPTDLTRPLCVAKEIPQEKLINHSCTDANEKEYGWCYVQRSQVPTERCAQSIKFSPLGTPPTGTVVSLQCIETAIGTGHDAGAAPTGDGG